MKIIWFDTETTGTDPTKHDIVQIAGIVEIDGKVIDEFEFFQQPGNEVDVDPKALEIQKKTMAEIMEYPPYGTVYASMIKLFDKHIKKFDPIDKFLAAGQNVQFDKQFLYALWAKYEDFYLGSYLLGVNLDLLTAVAIGVDLGLMDPPVNKKNRQSYKLEFIANRLGVSLENAHSAIDDIKAARECYLKLKGLFGVLDKY